MTLFCIDINTWLALSVDTHAHNAAAWSWWRSVPSDGVLVFVRYTQLGLLRLLTNRTVMGAETRSLRQAWEIYERWLQDARVEFHPEPHGMDAAFRHATASFDSEPASKWIGDGYLLAFAHRSSATLVTFAKALASLARKQGCRVVVPA
jgi:toxin-antitoxin system PIN domain toxin